MQLRPLPPPLVPPGVSLVTVTFKSLVLGILLSAVLASANAYIGLLVGMTVSASIPAAAVSMGIFRAFRRTNILENNLVQTAASSGESLVAGVIFTVPALVMMGAWAGYDYWPTVTLALLGGLLGCAFTIPLRRALIVEARLTFPEGLATAEVLKTGGIEYDRDHPEKNERSPEAVRGFRRLLGAAGIGGAIKLLESATGWMAGEVAGIKALLGGKVLAMGGITLSPALLGVGFIIGRNVASLIFLGGVIGTVIGVPVNWLLNQERLLAGIGLAPDTPLAALSAADWEALAGASWQNCRRIGVGAMLVGGFWSLISLARPLWRGVRASMAAYRASGSGMQGLERTERDLPLWVVGGLVLLALVPLYLVFDHALGELPGRLPIALLMVLLMLVFGFIFSCVAGYLAGLVGSSNNPISGVTVATVVISSVILLHLIGNAGIAGQVGPVAVIFLAALICGAAAISGDTMQDLKCGHIVGATPWKQQIFEFIGVAAAAFVIPLVLGVLDAGHGIGRAVRAGVTPLAAPQAGLMRDIASGIFGAGIEWGYIWLGCGLAVGLIILDQIQARRGADFRFPVLAVAVGIYLPLGLSVPIFAGGLLAAWARRRALRAGGDAPRRQENNGLLLASGLITGEALMGVLAAVALVTVIDHVPQPMAWAGYVGIAALAATGWLLMTND
jgi:putative OPT family oligopeptide transporter